jgi:dolichol-phosphate mannosyltransferase
MISLVIPTYNEADVIQETLRRAGRVLQGSGEPFELIVVDDSSPDGTADLAEGLWAELPVRVLRRKGERGLATAVVSGWRNARGDVYGVMDADLQHPPEVVCELLQALRAQDADLAVASRYRPGGGTEGWSWFRRLVSWGGMRVGAVALPWTLGVVTDPGSGLFLVRAEALKGVELKPLGFKMLLEVLAKARYQRIVEVPYVFRGRTRGQSKLGPRQYVEYLVSLLRMGSSSGELATWIYYALAGLAGGVVYVAALCGLDDRVGWPLALSLPLALQLGLLVSFIGDDAVSFRRPRPEDRSPSSAGARFLRYEKLLLPSALFNGFVTYLGRRLGLELWSAASFGFLAAFAWNFLFAVPAIWGIWQTTRRTVVAGKRP